MQNIIIKNLITEKIGAITVERIATASEHEDKLKNWQSLSHEYQQLQLNTYYSNLQEEKIYKESINRRCLLYFLLSEDFKFFM